jgi:multisubunit Na+/H+ antiporter MnhE subunit
VRSLLAAAVWWVVLCGLWLLYVGATTREVLVAGALAAAVAVALGAFLGRRGLLRFGLDERWLARALGIPWYLLRDFGLLTFALLRGRPRGAWVTMDFPVGGDDAWTAGRRALVGALGTITPNAYLVDFDRERQLVLLHELDPERAKGEPL